MTFVKGKKHTYQIQCDLKDVDSWKEGCEQKTKEGNYLHLTQHSHLFASYQEPKNIATYRNIIL